ncbi:MAG TPA: type III restriction endonuclease subunit R [Clostridiales bacterium]|nr:type III restriction endonuclease subunit R [Clostridiales bacterium]
MKLQFNPNLDYQQQAIASVVDLFLGQTPKQSNFTVSYMCGQIGVFDTQNGIGNKLELDEEDILRNLQVVQLRNGLPQTKKLIRGQYDFDIEMETGTGKTYVYLRSIYELNKAYGFTKFVIVVPSLAIKEGVKTSLKLMDAHFKNLYDNTICESFIYDSSKLDQVRNFAVSDNIQIMIINIDAFRRSFTDSTRETKANIIHRPNDRLNGMRPIELIQETHPFVIIDEPQSVDTTTKAKEAIASLNPMCIFRYSATHVEKHNLIYKLDAIDAYELELVKQIEVAGFEATNAHNNAYIQLVSVNNKKSPITARVKIDVQSKNGIQQKTVTVKHGDDLYEKSGRREVYDGYVVNDIYCEPGNEYIDFTSKPDVLRLGEIVGDFDRQLLKEMQIKKTVEEHLDKELILNKKGVKVLSLFFIDRVSNYRIYDEEGNPQKGIYAEMFEKTYRELIRKPKYHSLFEGIYFDEDVKKVHDGYFSIDKRTKAFKDTSGTTQEDDDAYTLIMQDKEKLLSFDSRLRFIFSHSALREGWDNPNVFQICTLNETKSDVKRRQEIGRGMRLCVNQNGERLHGFDTNTLTVMANESYEEFAEGLQHEIEKEEGIRFGVIEAHTFANIPVEQEDGSVAYLGQEASEALFEHFQVKNYIDARGKVTDILKADLKNEKIEIPPEYEACKDKIIALTRKISGKLNIKNNDDKRKIKLNKQVYLSPEFKQLWDRIKYKTTYSVQFDSNELVEKCSREIEQEINVRAPKWVYRKGGLDITAGGVIAEEQDTYTVGAVNENVYLPDIISFLQNKTFLKRKTIVDILIKSKTLLLFKKNPQKYLDEVAKLISSELRLMIVDGIKYTKVGKDAYYTQELFQNEELYGYLSKNMLESQKSVYEYVIYDSDTEANFAQRFESNASVKLYAKLPDWFKINTPIGSYNPDWAVLVENDGDQKLYFVLETKGNILAEALRPTEHAKIQCGYEHFRALGNEVVFKPVDSIDGFIEGI